MVHGLGPVRKLWPICLAGAILAANPACKAPSLLITPVSGKKELEETELERTGYFAADKIALIDVSGLIRNADSGSFLGPRENPVSLLLEQLHQAGCDPAVKAVILRINSPGGTVVASELMHDEIMHFRRTTGKPVTAVMMDMATSGGYYIACACDEIVAQPSTVTGSIGVVMLMFDLTGTMNKIGLRSEAITSGRYKDAGSPFRTMTPDERELFRNIVLDMYERFVTVVKAGRPGLGDEDVRRLADGRVYTASQALEAGLIDRVASLRQTMCDIQADLGLRAIRLVAYQRPYEDRPNYYAFAPMAPPTTNVNLLNINMPNSFLPRAPEFLYLWAPQYFDEAQ